MKSPNLETLTAGMRKKLSWADIDETLKKDPKVKLPDRRALTLTASVSLVSGESRRTGKRRRTAYRTCRSDRPKFERSRGKAAGMWSNRATSRRRSTPILDASI